MSIKHLYEDERPSLLLDFANSKTLDPRITFTRNSTATYVDEQGVIKTAAAGEARFDHDPVTGESLGLLIEESRTNYVPDSSSLDTDWNNNIGSSNRAIDAGTTIAPTGVDEAFHLGCQVGANAITWCYFSYGYFYLPSTGTYTVSVFVKQTPGVDNNIQWFRMTHGGMGYACCWDWNTLDYDQTSKNNLDLVTPEYYGDGWWRIGAYADVTDASVLGYAAIGLGDTDNNGNRTKPNRMNTNGGYFYGFQLEKGSFITSIIPTPAGATATRAVDACQITGDNFSSWYNQGEGTFVFTATPPQGPSRAPFFATGLSANVSSKMFGTWIYDKPASGYGNKIDVFQIDTGGNVTAQERLAVNDDGSTFKASAAYTPTSIHGSYNGGTVVSDTANSIAPDMLFIGARGSTAGSNYIGQLSYYPTRLSDTALEALTK